MEKQFNFADEKGIYKLWEESGFFNPDNIDSNEKYCNILPPPNSNGELKFETLGGKGFCYLQCHGIDHSPREYIRK